VIVGEKGRVTGMVAGQKVIVRGAVSGVICGRSVSLQTSSHVEADLHHMTLVVEQGAMFEGRSRRAPDEAALSAVVEGRGAGPQDNQIALRAVPNGLDPLAGSPRPLPGPCHPSCDRLAPPRPNKGGSWGRLASLSDGRGLAMSVGEHHPHARDG
jgi:hypothetical protein